VTNTSPEFEMFATLRNLNYKPPAHEALKLRLSTRVVGIVLYWNFRRVV